jgi:mono/diheme cytochrome c family protein
MSSDETQMNRLPQILGHSADPIRLAKFMVLLAAFAAGSFITHAAEPGPDFTREVRPILSQHCFTCHGPDDKSRKAGLRLDVRDAALKGGDSDGEAIVPGKPDASALLARVLSHDPDEVMPPPTEKKPLSPTQVATLRRWISSGADYAKHWAFEPPVKAPVPAGTHPVDALVRDKLLKEKLSPAPQAESAVLARRLYLDVIGLPPSPTEIDEFEKANAADSKAAISELVERLLKNERHGEKWARHWLDVARYSDSNGYERDYPREQWAWRDWVVCALNEDMPYDRFVIEQIAGDLLPNHTQAQMVATGLLRNSMTNEEGAIIPEQFRMEEMFDRMDCVGKAVLGLTIQCAQCHSHKFDPVSHDEYFGVFAFLNNTFEARSPVFEAEQQEEIAAIQDGIRAAEERLRAARPKWREELRAWSDEVLKQQPVWTPLDAEELYSSDGMTHPTKEPGSSILTQGPMNTGAYTIIVAEPELAGVTGLCLEALPHRDLHFGGPGRGAHGTWALSDLKVSVLKPGAKDYEDLKLVEATADFSMPQHPEPAEWVARPKKSEDNLDETVAQKKTVAKKVERLCGPVEFLIDGKLETSWRADRGAGRRNVPSAAVVRFAQALQLPSGTKMKVMIHLSGGQWPYGMQLGHVRVSLTTAPAPHAAPMDHAAILALQTPAEQRTPAEQAALFAAWRVNVPELKPFNDEIEAWWLKFPTAPTSVLHLKERDPFYQRETRLLDRGGWDKPKHVVAPQTPAALHPLPPGAKPDRLTFARWLVDARSPLAARVAVNRVWQAIFGAGLVETAEDFGTRAPMPEQLALLDWLAVDFMEHGWSQRHLLRTILTSATYQQSSLATPAALERDPRNQFLARGPRFRVDAEVVRDLALGIAGLLTHRSGGAPTYPPVPESVLENNYVKPPYWKPSQGPERYLRALYLFRKRSMPDPMLSSFDAPSSDFACARRLRSNTALAALTGLNEPIMVEAAQALAQRILHEGGGTDEHRAAHAYRLCVSRSIRPAEREKLLTLISSTRERIANGALNADEIIADSSAKRPAGINAQDAAAWTLAARVLLNLDETLTKN